MTADLWTVFVAAVLPYVPYLMVAFEKNRRGIYDPANPRDSNAQLEGWSARAKAAEANSWEALAQYVAVSFVAHAAGGDDATLALVGWAWVAARLVYYGVYVGGLGQARIAAWFVGVALLFARVGVVFGS